MRFALSFLALALLLTGCGGGKVSLPATDDEIRQKLPGTWQVKIEVANASTKGTLTLTPEGGLLTKLTFVRTNNTQDVTYQGFWQVEDKYLLTTITNTDNPEAQSAIGRTNRLKLLGLDKRRLVFETKVNGVSTLRRQ